MESANTVHCSEKSSHDRLDEKTVVQWSWNWLRCSLLVSGRSISVESSRLGGRGSLSRGIALEHGRGGGAWRGGVGVEGWEGGRTAAGSGCGVCVLGLGGGLWGGVWEESASRDVSLSLEDASWGRMAFLRRARSRLKVSAVEDGICSRCGGGDTACGCMVAGGGEPPWRMEWIKSSSREEGEGMMDRLLWTGIGGAGVATGRLGEFRVGVSLVGEHAPAEDVVAVGWSGGGMSWRKRFISSWVDSLGLSSIGVLVGDRGCRRLRDRGSECGRGFAASAVWEGCFIAEGWEASCVDAELGGDSDWVLGGEGGLDFFFDGSAWARE